MRKTKRFISVFLAAALFFLTAAAAFPALAAGPEGPVPEDPAGEARLYAAAASPAKVFVKEGGSAEMKVRAFSSIGEVRYKWVFVPEDAGAEEVPLANGDGPECTVKNIKRAGHYKCIVYDEKENNRAVDFTVGVENGFYACPEGETQVYCYSGNAVTLRVAAGAATGEITYRWRMSTQTTDPETGTVTYETAVLPLEALPQIDAVPVGVRTDYVCEASDIYGNRAEVCFSVKMLSDVRVLSDLYNTVFVPFGEDAELEVKTDLIAGSVRYRWYKNTDEGAEPVSGAESAVLPLTGVKACASYVCAVLDDNGCRTDVSFNVYVDSGLAVLQPAYWNEIFVAEGGCAQLYVQAQANPGEAVYYSWYVTDPNDPDWLWRITEETGMGLDTEPVTEDLLYCCCVSDDYGRVEYVYFYVLLDNGFEVGGCTTADDIAYTYIISAGTDVEMRTFAHIGWGRELSFEWFINGDKLDHTGETLLLENVCEDLIAVCNVSDAGGRTVSERHIISVNYGETAAENKNSGVALSYCETVLPPGFTLEVQPVSGAAPAVLPSVYDRVYEISVRALADGRSVTPNKIVLIRADLPEELREKEKFAVYRVGEDLRGAEIPAAAHGDFVTFVAEALGRFVIADVSSKRFTGDVDGNGEIEPADARLALRCSLGLTQDGDKKMTDNDILMADADGDGEVQPGDARLILRRSLGLPVANEGWYDTWD